MAEFKCERCESTWIEDTLPRRGEICFACHLKSIRIGFTHGKENFSGPTIRELQNKTISDAAAAGRTIEPAGSRWV
jgi:hypothetical protein